MTKCNCGCGLERPPFSDYEPKTKFLDSRMNLALLLEEMDGNGWTNNAIEYVRRAIIFVEGKCPHFCVGGRCPFDVAVMEIKRIKS